MAEFMTRDNVLAYLESLGHELAADANPGTYSFEDRHKAKMYEKPLQACRWAWAKIFDGAEMIPVLNKLKKALFGVPSNSCSLLISALEGSFEKPIVGTGEFAYSMWVTFEGDLYLVRFGDYLNLPEVSRLANRHLPNEKKVISGSQKIAETLPNPCTRIIRPVRFN